MATGRMRAGSDSVNRSPAMGSSIPVVRSRPSPAERLAVAVLADLLCNLDHEQSPKWESAETGQFDDAACPSQHRRVDHAAMEDECAARLAGGHGQQKRLRPFEF